MKNLLFILLGTISIQLGFARAANPLKTLSLLPGAELLFKDVKTSISDVDKNDIFLQTGLYYDPAKKNLTPGKGISTKDFILQVYPTDMNRDGKEEIFIGETKGVSPKQKQTFEVFIPKNGKYMVAGKMDIPTTAYYLFVYKTTNFGYNDIGYNSPAKLYRYNGSEYKESGLKPGDYIEVINDYSQNYTSPKKFISDPLTITNYVFQNVKTKMTERERMLFTKDVVIQYRDNIDTSLKYEYEGSGITDDMPIAALDIFPVDLNKDGVEEVFMRLNTTFFGPWLAQLNLFIKNKSGQYVLQDSISEPRLFVRTTGFGGYPDLIGAPPEGPGSYKIPTKFNVYRWNGKSYQLYKHDQPYVKSDLSVEEDVGPAYQASLPNSLLRGNVVFDKPGIKSTPLADEALTTTAKTASATTEAELTPLATALFKSAQTKLSAAQKNEVAYLTGVKPDEINAKNRNGKLKYGFDIYPLDLNKNGTEEIFLCITTKPLGIPMHTYYFYTLNNLGHYQPSPGVIGQGVKILLNRVAEFPDLICGATLGDHQVWRWNGQAYRLAQTIKAGLAIDYPTKSIEDASKEYVESQ